MKQDDDLALQEPASREVFEPGGRWSKRLGTGNRLRIVDLEGQQAIDFLCYSDEPLLDRCGTLQRLTIRRLTKAAHARYAA